MTSSSNPSGRVAWITGAAAGIGRAIALRLAREGAAVALCDVNEEGLAETARLVREGGGEPHVWRLDVSVDQEVVRVAGEIVESLGGLEIVVNNAGLATAGFMDSAGESEVERVMSVNLHGVLRVTRAAAPHLKAAGWGRIVNLSSVEGLRGSGLLPIYCASKAGVLGLTRANAVEFARFGTTVNAICPGPIETAMLAPLVATDALKQKMLKSIPMRRFGQPEEIAGVAAFLCSDDAAFVTGQAIAVDGGLSCHV